MNHLNEEQLVLLHYGESEEEDSARRHLEACPECRAAYSRLQQTLAAVSASSVPERGEDYGFQVWRRIAPRLEQKSAFARFWGATLAGPVWKRAAVTAFLLVVAFLAGRYGQQPAPLPAPPVASAPASERILLVAVGNHLERSRMVLVELVHAEPNGGVNISTEQQQARRLLADNRLYRQVAERSGEGGTAQVLDELERVLVEVANGPSELSAHDLEVIQKRIQSQGILFKVRILATQTRRKAAPRAPANVQKGKS